MDGGLQWGHAVVGLGPPTGRRQLQQDLRLDLKMILRLSGRRGSRARAPWHRRWTACRRHSKGPPQVGTVPGPLLTASAAPHEGGGPRRAAPTSPEGHEATAWHRTDVRRGGGRL